MGLMLPHGTIIYIIRYRKRQRGRDACASAFSGLTLHFSQEYCTFLRANKLVGDELGSARHGAFLAVLHANFRQIGK